MKRIVWFMHVSLDGFVTDSNGSMAWVNVDAELFDYAGKQTERSDTALYARKTFELMEGYWPTAADQPNASKHDIEHSTWYKQVNKYVISGSWAGKSVPNATLISEHVVDEIRKLKQGEGKDIVIFGSPSLGKLLTSENLIDDYWIFVNPIILGEGGIPLFKDIKTRTALKLVSSIAFSSGVVGLHYEAKR
jgi:dihydrofolate reductase